jgi:hypothetical protein
VAPEVLHDGRKAAAERNRSGGWLGFRAAADWSSGVGFGEAGARATRAAVLIGGGETPWCVGPWPHACEAGSGSELPPRSNTDPRSGMTGGVRPSATAAGGRALGRAGPSWAVSGAAAGWREGLRRAGPGIKGAFADFGTWAA